MPNEVPIEYEDPSIDFLLRRVYEGMVHCMDSGIGNITAALKKTGAYEKTLIVFSAGIMRTGSLLQLDLCSVNRNGTNDLYVVN